MNGPDHPESVGVDSGGEGFVVPRLGHEEHGAGEGDEGKKGQGRGESRRAQEEEFSMNLWLMGSSNGGSSTTSSTAGWFPASSSQTQVTLAAPGCVLAPSWSISGFSNTQSQGGAAGKEREGRAGAEAEVGRGGSSGGEAEGGDDAAEGWHPTPPAVVQSPFGVSTRLEGPEPGQAEEGGDMDRVWEELYVQRECASQPSSPKESRGALPAIKRLLVVRRESVQRSDSRDSLASTDSRSSISRHATLGNDGWQQLDMAGGEGDVPRQRRRRRRRHSMDSIHLEAAGLKQRAASELAMHRSPPSPLSPSSQGPSLRAAEGAHAGWHGQPGVRSGRPIPVARPVPSPLQPPSPRLPAVRSSPLMSYEHPDLASPPRRAAVPVHAPKLQQCMTGALPGHEGQEEEKACMRVLSGDGSCVSETGSMRIYHVPSKPMAPSSTAPDRSSLHQKQQKWQHRPALEVPPSPDGLSPHATGGRRLKSAPVSPSGHLVSPLASPAVASWDEPCRIDHRAFVRLYTDEGASSNRSNMWDISRECGGSERMASDSLQEQSSFRGASFSGGSMRDLLSADAGQIKEDRSASRGDSCGCGALEASACICSTGASSPSPSARKGTTKPSSSFRFFASLNRSVRIEIPDDTLPHLPVSQSLPDLPADSAARDPRSTLELFHSSSQPPLWQPSSPVGVRSQYAESIRERAKRAMESQEAMDSAWEDQHVAQIAQSTPTSPCRSPGAMNMMSPKSLRRMLLAPVLSSTSARKSSSAAGSFEKEARGTGSARASAPRGGGSAFERESGRRTSSLKGSVECPARVDWSGRLSSRDPDKEQLVASPRMARNLTVDVRRASESTAGCADLDFFSSEWEFPAAQSVPCAHSGEDADSPPYSPRAVFGHSCMPPAVSAGLRIISSPRSSSPRLSSPNSASPRLPSPRSPSLRLPSFSSLSHPSPRSKGKASAPALPSAHSCSGPLSPQVSRKVPAWEEEEVAVVGTLLAAGGAVGEIAVRAAGKK
ncbi:unnamed protein product [Closterium sp. NIES-64]|nr:unnamed protein product [Closterium sp. NIES-64]